MHLANLFSYSLCRCQDDGYHGALEYPCTKRYLGFNTSVGLNMISPNVIILLLHYVELVDRIFFIVIIPESQVASDCCLRML